MTPADFKAAVPDDGRVTLTLTDILGDPYREAVTVLGSPEHHGYKLPHDRGWALYGGKPGAVPIRRKSGNR